MRPSNKKIRIVQEMLLTNSKTTVQMKRRVKTDLNIRTSVNVCQLTSL